MSEDRTKELANIEKLNVAETTLQEARAQGSEIVHVGWLDDAARGTPQDPDAVRSRVGATQVSTYDREDVVQATLPTKASRIILSPAATKPNAKDQHHSQGVGWRRVNACYGKRETNMCWRNEIKNILTGVPAVDDSRTFASENHGYVTIRRGTELFSSGRCCQARADGTLQHKGHATHRTDGVWWRDDRRTPLMQKEEKEPTRICMGVKQ